MVLLEGDVLLSAMGCHANQDQMKMFIDGYDRYDGYGETLTTSHATLIMRNGNEESLQKKMRPKTRL